MKIFSADYLDTLSLQAKCNPRKRQHDNLHKSYQEAAQRLFNAIEPTSYIRPHRHSVDPRDELLVAVRGSMVLIIFDEHGNVIEPFRFGSTVHDNNLAIGVEVPANTWHTVIALEPGCILLEVKAGPFDPCQPKELASWAPEEGSDSAQDYLSRLVLYESKESLHSQKKTY
jgi:cupin fold WbuC family metalloprotein